MDTFYPTISTDYLIEKISNCPQVIQGSHKKIGKTNMFVLDGPQAISKRIILIRDVEEGQVYYDQATSVAAKLRFLGDLIKWLEDNRNWKEGAFIVPKEETQEVK